MTLRVGSRRASTIPSHHVCASSSLAALCVGTASIMFDADTSAGGASQSPGMSASTMQNGFWIHELRSDVFGDVPSAKILCRAKVYRELSRSQERARRLEDLPCRGTHREDKGLPYHVELSELKDGRLAVHLVPERTLDGTEPRKKSRRWKAGSLSCAATANSAGHVGAY